MLKQWDCDLVAQVAAGDNNAFLTLYERYVKSIHGLVLRILRDSTLADEVTQDTFLKLWDRASQYLAERGPVHGWLLAIARHTALDYLRHEAHNPALTNEHDSEDLWQDIADINTSTEEARWRSLHFAVQSLSDVQRQVIELIYYQGLSQREISEVLGWPIGTVKTRLRTAIEQLRLAWAEE